MVIPDGVTSIGEDAFGSCDSLTSVDIPDSVTSIDDWAFARCSSLTSVDIPDGVTSIGEYAFTSCTGLTSVTLPASLTTVSDSAFYNCSSLTSVTIPDGVTSIEDYAFYDCTSLTSVTIPASVESIERMAFGYYVDEETWEDVVIDGFTIYGYTGTAAETYATENGITFVALDSDLDLTDLVSSISAATALTESDYTADSWTALQTALTNAQAVAANSSATQAEVDAAAAALNSAVSALVKATTTTVDTSALTTAISTAAALTESDYTSSSWSALQTALTNAQAVAANSSATQAEVDAAAAALNSAVSALVKAETSSSTSTTTTTETVTVPAATKITALVNKASGIRVDWTKVSNATSYKVYRKIGSGSWKLVKTTSSTSWMDTAAKKNGTKYQYKVYAVNAAGTSKASATKAIFRLTAKHFIRAKNVKCRKISLKWTRNKQATGYQIQYSTSADFSNATTIKIKGNKKVTTTLKNLKKGTTYYIRMRPYKTGDGMTSSANWSKVKTVKVKK